MDTWSLQRVEEELDRYALSQPIQQSQSLDTSLRADLSNTGNGTVTDNHRVDHSHTRIEKRLAPGAVEILSGDKLMGKTAGKTSQDFGSPSNKIENHSKIVIGNISEKGDEEGDRSVQSLNQRTYRDSDSVTSTAVLNISSTKHSTTNSIEMGAVKYFTEKYSRTGINLLDRSNRQDQLMGDEKSDVAKDDPSRSDIQGKGLSPARNQISSPDDKIGSKSQHYYTPDKGSNNISLVGDAGDGINNMSQGSRPIPTSDKSNYSGQSELTSPNSSSRLETKLFSSSFVQIKNDAKSSSPVSTRVPFSVAAASVTSTRMNTTQQNVGKPSAVISLLSTSLLPMIPLYPKDDQSGNAGKEQKFDASAYDRNGESDLFTQTLTPVSISRSNKDFMKSDTSLKDCAVFRSDTVNQMAPLSLKTHGVSVHSKTLDRTGRCSSEKNRTLQNRLNAMTGDSIRSSPTSPQSHSSPMQSHSLLQSHSSSKTESSTPPKGFSLISTPPSTHTNNPAINPSDGSKGLPSQGNSASLRRGVSLMRSFRASKDLFSSHDVVEAEGIMTPSQSNRAIPPTVANHLQRQSNFRSSCRDSKVQGLQSPIKDDGSVGSISEHRTNHPPPQNLNEYRALDVINNRESGPSEPTSCASNRNKAVAEESFHSISEKLDRLSRSNDLLDRIADSNESLYDITDGRSLILSGGQTVAGSPDSCSDYQFGRTRNCASFRSPGKNRRGMNNTSRNNSSGNLVDGFDTSSVVTLTSGEAQTLPRLGRKVQGHSGKGLGSYGLTVHQSSAQSSVEHTASLDSSGVTAGRVSDNKRTFATEYVTKLSGNRDDGREGHVTRRVEDERLSEREIHQVEMFYRSHKTDVLVCRCVTDLYMRAAATNLSASATSGNGEASSSKSSPSKAAQTKLDLASKVGETSREAGATGASSSAHEAMEGWNPAGRGVAVLLLDTGGSRRERRLTIALAERGTGFTLWKDRIDNLTSYQVDTPTLHTLHLSRDHSRLAGLRFQDSAEAERFHQGLVSWTTVDHNDPLLRISKSGKGHGGWSLRRSFRKLKKDKTKPPTKTDISAPCCFVHVTKLDRGVDMNPALNNS